MDAEGGKRGGGVAALTKGLTRTEVVERLRAAGCVFATAEARLLIAEARTPASLSAMLERRVAGVPLEHVLGWAAFCGLRVVVDEGVFVPRRRTELLVRRALAGLRREAVAVDMCCGSGAVGAALLASIPSLEVHAVDIDPTAVRCARKNLAPRGHTYRGDLYAALPSRLRGRVDVIVANAPYVPTQAIALMPSEARVFEHRVSLDGGADGLDVLRRVTEGAAKWLKAGGMLVVETSERRAPVMVEVVQANGLAAKVYRSSRLDAHAVVGRLTAKR